MSIANGGELMNGVLSEAWIQLIELIEESKWERNGMREYGMSVNEITQFTLQSAMKSEWIDLI